MSYILTTNKVIDAAIWGVRAEDGISSPLRNPLSMSYLESLYISTEMRKLSQVVDRFSRTQWFPDGGLRSIVRSSVKRGISGKAYCLVAGRVILVDMLLYSIAGRCLISLRCQDGEISLVADETCDTYKEGRLGIQCVESTPTVALGLLSEAFYWKFFGLKENENVRIAGI